MTYKSSLNLVAMIVFFCLGCATRKSSLTPTSELKSLPGSIAPDDHIITGILAQYPQYFDSLLKNNQKWEIKIIYTQIDRKNNNRPVFTNHYFNIEPGQYFYPASTVKMPTAAMALQKLRELKIRGLDRNTTMITDSGYHHETALYNDPESADGRPTIANYIKKIFLVSDNYAFNRLYEFTGQEYLNRTLQKMGYDSAQILHRLEVSMTEDENRHTNPISFYDPSLNAIYRQPLAESKMQYQTRFNLLGNGYYAGGRLEPKPFDFSRKNRLSLPDLHSILESILFPKSVARKQRFHLKKSDYRFLYKYMSMKPGESRFPQYDSTYPEAYSKLLLYGGKGKIDSSIRIFNKEGDAYGFLTDVAYIVDLKNKIEFLLSASILCNSDGIFNDNHYDYDKVGYPFLKNLGQVIYNFELQRKRRNVPDLSKFRLIYAE